MVMNINRRVGKKSFQIKFVIFVSHPGFEGDGSGEKSTVASGMLQRNQLLIFTFLAGLL